MNTPKSTFIWLFMNRRHTSASPAAIFGQICCSSLSVTFVKRSFLPQASTIIMRAGGELLAYFWRYSISRTVFRMVEAVVPRTLLGKFLS
jgi:hypothetical protein